MKIDEAYHTLMKRYLWLVLVCIQPIFLNHYLPKKFFLIRLKFQWDAVSQNCRTDHWATRGGWCSSLDSAPRSDSFTIRLLAIVISHPRHRCRQTQCIVFTP